MTSANIVFLLNNTCCIFRVKLALSIDSTLAGAHWNLGSFYYLKAQQLEIRMLNEIDTEKRLYAIDVQVFSRHGKLTETTSSPDVFSAWLNEPTPAPGNPFKLPVVSSNPQLHFPSAGDIFQSFTPELPIAAINNNDRNQKLLNAPIYPTPNIPLNPVLAQRQNEFHIKIRQIEEKYVPQIKAALARFRWHKDKAKELGIVTKLPEEFFRLQAKDIEKFKRTGEY